MADVRREPEQEPKPTYMRLWFVAAVAVFAVLLGWLLHRWGTGSDVEPAGEGEVVAAVPEAAAETPRTPEPGRREDCPDPGAEVELEAAELIRFFTAEASNPGFSDFAASPEVEAQLEAADPAPAVSRMTRVRGFVGEPGSWSSCVLSTWMGADGPVESLDVVTVALVDPDDGDPDGGDAGAGDGDAGDGDAGDGDPDGEDGDGGEVGPTTSTTTRSSTTTTTERATASSGRRSGSEPRWEVIRWLRGTPQPVPPSRVTGIALYDDSTSCRNPDRLVSVPVADGEPSDRLVLALEELLSGTPGRSPTASSRVPADLQVLDAEVIRRRVRVELTETSDDLTRCAGTAAYEQVTETAAVLAADAADADPEDIDVEVIIDGDEVSTLR